MVIPEGYGKRALGSPRGWVWASEIAAWRISGQRISVGSCACGSHLLPTAQKNACFSLLVLKGIDFTTGSIYIYIYMFPGVLPKWKFMSVES